MQIDRSVIARNYINAEVEYVATRLKFILRYLSKPEDVTIHNFVSDELAAAIGVKENDEEKMAELYKELAQVVINHAKKGYKSGEKRT